jgi:hypothetical protein
MKHRHHHHPKPLHHGEDRVLRALRLLADTGMIKSIEDLITYAEKGGHQQEAEFFRNLLAEPIPVELALDELSVIYQKDGHRRDRALLGECRTGRVGLLMPLPPHILDEFLNVGTATILIPNGHHLPPHLRHADVRVLQGTRACRQAAGEVDVLVFEGYAENGQYLCESDVADIVDVRILKPGARLVLHLRPHSHPDDVNLDSLPQVITEI